MVGGHLHTCMCIQPSTWSLLKNILRICLDIDIELLELYWVPMPNQTSIGNGLNTKSAVWMWMNLLSGIEWHVQCQFLFGCTHCGIHCLLPHLLPHRTHNDPAAQEEAAPASSTKAKVALAPALARRWRQRGWGPGRIGKSGGGLFLGRRDGGGLSPGYD